MTGIVISPRPYKPVIAILLLLITVSANSSALSEVPANELQSKIFNREDVIYNNVSFKGNFNLINDTIISNIVIVNSSFEQVSLTHSTFLKKVDFRKCTFLNDSDFSYSKFQGFTNFENSTFKKNASFIEAEFAEISFENSSFMNFANFDYAIFNHYSTLHNASFQNSSFPETEYHGVSDFSSSHFKGKPIFSQAHFFDFADFKDVEFSEGADFIATNFDYITAFTKSKFGEGADFSYATFGGPTHFGYVTFNNQSNFQLSVFSNLAYFIGSSFGSDLDLTGSKIDCIKLENTTYQNGSRIILKDSDFSKFQTHWSHVSDHLVYDGAAYLKIVKSYKDLEWFSDADDCYYQYRAISQSLKDWSTAKIFDMLAGITCGYGVRPAYPVYCSAVLISFCTAIFFLGSGLKSPQYSDKRRHFSDSLYYCLAIFFTIPLPDLKPVGRYRYVPVFLRALSWTLFALLIATLGKVMIR